MPMDKNEQNIVAHVPNPGRRPSEYASVKHAVKEGGQQQVYIETVDALDSSAEEMSSAVQKITERYDSLGKLRASLENLDINEDDPAAAAAVGAGDVKVPLYYREDQAWTAGGGDRLLQDHRVYNRCNSNDISEQDLEQVEAFFRSHKTVVYVCPTLVNLYFSAVDSSYNNCTLACHGPTAQQHRQRPTSWQLAHTGIPVLLLDTGETRCRTKRRIQIILAEKGTGFLLWKDTIDNLTNYQAPDSHFHTMYLSVDHRKLVGLSFDDVSAAHDFYDRIETLTADPANISLSGPSSKTARKAAAKGRSKKKTAGDKARLPKKTDISQPCCFQHVTKVDLVDREQFVTLSTLTGSAKKHAATVAPPVPEAVQHVTNRA